MRKKFLMPDYRKWLELYENGESERWIAREHAKCDVRTVKRGIEKASLERDARMVRTELLRQALKSHQESLLDLMKEILKCKNVKIDRVPNSPIHVCVMNERFEACFLLK